MTAWCLPRASPTSKEVLLRRPGKGAVSSMMWDGDGQRLVFGTETGDCGVIDISG